MSISPLEVNQLYTLSLQAARSFCPASRCLGGATSHTACLKAFGRRHCPGHQVPWGTSACSGAVKSGSQMRSSWIV